MNKTILHCLPLLTFSIAALPALAQTKVNSVARRPGYIVGRAVKTNGAAVPSFTVDYSGFEDGKLAASYNGQLSETISSSVKGSGGRYAVKVPKGAYRASAYATYHYRGRVYYFDMEPTGLPVKQDYDSLGLSKLRTGLIRNFVLKMKEKKAGASEESESLYRTAYYGGIVNVDTRQYDATLGGGNAPSPSLQSAYPKDSRILLTLTPVGPRVDGSAGQVVNADMRLGDDGLWTFMVRGVFPGVYTATAKLKLGDGSVKPLKISNKPSRTVLKPGSYDQVIFDRGPSATVDFLPNDLGPQPCMGVKPVQLYLGE